MTLVRKLAKIGKNWGIILPREVLEAAEIDWTTKLTLRADRGKIVLARLPSESSDPFTLLRRRIPRSLSDKKVSKILARSLRRVRQSATSQRGDR